MLITTTTGRQCFSTVTGSARAVSINFPKPYLASLADMVFKEPAALNGHFGHTPQLFGEPQALIAATS